MYIIILGLFPYVILSIAKNLSSPLTGGRVGRHPAEDLLFARIWGTGED